MQRDIFTGVRHLLSGNGARGAIGMSMETTMANDGPEPNGGGTNHRETYDSFMSITKKAIIAIAVVLILMAIFLA
jgi:hypothetical protein